MSAAPSQQCVVFLHAHPDDEAIFTGGTIARLVADGARVVVVLATCGAPDPASELAAVRTAEVLAACELLGVHRVELLGYADSGLRGDDAAAGCVGFAAAPLADVRTRLLALLREEFAAALVVYDDGGIYGHPDHVAVHRCAESAEIRAAVPTIYECTVDREYLHFVETHLVGHAVASLLGMEVPVTNTAPLGVPTVLVSTTIDVRPQAALKRAAIAAHASQVAADSETLTMPMGTFEGVYGFEWYVRKGERGPLERCAF